MKYAIIGFGKIGHALAEAFARNGIEVSCLMDRNVSADRIQSGVKKTERDR